jgi:hypothetical protein
MIELYDTYKNKLREKYNTLAVIDDTLFCQLIEEVYNDGASDGQSFVWKMRSGDFDEVEITEAGKKIGLTKEDFTKTETGDVITITNSY